MERRLDQQQAAELLSVTLPVEALALRRAYLRAVRRHPPERDPAGFDAVRSAYEVLQAALDSDAPAQRVPFDLAPYPVRFSSEGAPTFSPLRQDAEQRISLESPTGVDPAASSDTSPAANPDASSVGDGSVPVVQVESRAGANGANATDSLPPVNASETAAPPEAETAELVFWPDLPTTEAAAIARGFFADPSASLSPPPPEWIIDLHLQLVAEGQPARDLLTQLDAALERGVYRARQFGPGAADGLRIAREIEALEGEVPESFRRRIARAVLDANYERLAKQANALHPGDLERVHRHVAKFAPIIYARTWHHGEPDAPSRGHGALRMLWMILCVTSLLTGGVRACIAENKPRPWMNNHAGAASMIASDEGTRQDTTAEADEQARVYQTVEERLRAAVAESNCEKLSQLVPDLIEAKSEGRLRHLNASEFEQQATVACPELWPVVKRYLQ